MEEALFVTPLTLCILTTHQEAVNTLDAERRANLGEFLDAIETALMEHVWYSDKGHDLQ